MEVRTPPASAHCPLPGPAGVCRWAQMRCGLPRSLPLHPEWGGAMATNLQRYEILKRHMPEEAARVIAEAFPAADQLVTRDYLDARLGELRAETHRWMLAFMATQWLGLTGMIVTVLLKT